MEALAPLLYLSRLPGRSDQAMSEAGVAERPDGTSKNSGRRGHPLALIAVRWRVILGCPLFQIYFRSRESILFQCPTGGGSRIIMLTKLRRGNTFILTEAILVCSEAGNLVHTTMSRSTSLKIFP